MGVRPDISIVIPLYNEEEVLKKLLSRIDKVVSTFDPLGIEIVLINDGSTDNTEQLIMNKALSDKSYTSVSLSRNFGHQKAVTAGIEIASGTKGIMIIDGDLQDPPELLTQLYNTFLEGYDVVYAIRKNRKENFFKKVSYKLFYRILNAISKIELPVDSGDFCFISRRVADHLIALPEESRYLRGLRAWIGFKQKGISYERDLRYAGTSKYSFSKLISLATDGLYNFSEVPLKIIMFLGIFGIATSTIYFIYVLIAKFLTTAVPSGFTTIIFVIIFFGCVQLVSLGILGNYLIRIFFQVKGRPHYVVDKIKSHYYIGD